MSSDFANPFDISSQDIDVFHDFDNFDFDSKEFNDGLLAIFKSYHEQFQSSPDGFGELQKLGQKEKSQLIIQAKVYYYCTKTGNILNLLEYFHWKDIQQKEKLLLQSNFLDLEKSPHKSNQLSNKTFGANQSTSSGQSGQKETYSSNYQNIVQLIMSGKPIPGIKKIPNTILKQSSKSVKTQRKKPNSRSTNSS